MKIMSVNPKGAEKLLIVEVHEGNKEELSWHQLRRNQSRSKSKRC